MSVSHAAVAAAIFTSGVFVNVPSPASTPSPAAADELPDAGILAAAPFRFKADREIFNVSRKRPSIRASLWNANNGSPRIRKSHTAICRGRANRFKRRTFNFRIKRSGR
jgi:hypothetical protein